MGRYKDTRVKCEECGQAWVWDYEGICAGCEERIDRADDRREAREDRQEREAA